MSPGSDVFHGVFEIKPGATVLCSSPSSYLIPYVPAPISASVFEAMVPLRKSKARESVCEIYIQRDES